MGIRGRQFDSRPAEDEENKAKLVIVAIQKEVSSAHRKVEEICLSVTEDGQMVPIT